MQENEFSVVWTFSLAFEKRQKYILKDVLAYYLNIFHSIENQVTMILSCVLSPSTCQDAFVLLLSGHTFEKDSKDLEQKNVLLLQYPDSFL